jgi:hypothetical protein
MPDGITIDLTAVLARFASNLQRFAQRVQTESAGATRAQMSYVRQALIATSPVETGYLQAHWGAVEERSGGSTLLARVENPTPYGPILEYGGYRSVGPRTVAVGGGALGLGFQGNAGIYSKQAPLGFVRKALVEAWPQYRQRLQTVLRQAWPYDSIAGSSSSGDDLGALFGIHVVGSPHITFSPGTQKAVRDVMRELRSTVGRRR